MELKVRKSMLADFNLCPRMFKYVWIDQIPRAVARPAVVGKTFHEFANEFFDVVEYKKAKSMLSVRQVRDYFVSLIPEDVNSEIRTLCENFCAFEAYRLMSVDEKHFYPLERELHVDTPDLEGTIDRIDLLDDNEVMPIEYKTGLRVEPYALKREVVFYALLVNFCDSLDFKATKVGCYMPRTQEFWTAEINSKSIRALARNIAKLKQAVKQKDFPRNVSGVCRVCGYGEMCLWEADLLEEV